LPNYKWLPIAYHGRSSSIVISGTPIRRPSGQAKLSEPDAPTFGPSRQLDFELELGLYIGSGNQLGEPIPIDKAEENIFGLSLLNDWSARDIQRWEYQPLGPFLAKNFATTVSPWIVTLEALAPFRYPAFTRAESDPKPLPYLSLNEEDGANGGIDISLEVALSTHEMRERGLDPHVICRGSSRDLYWTISQLVAHHTSNGCNLRPGDLLGSGTISGNTEDACGSLLEMTKQGTSVIQLPTGQQRTYLEQGDQVVIRGWCHNKTHVQIGFGECLGRIQA
jgi:fumarylacetoacetase